MLLPFQSFIITPLLGIKQHIVILQPSTICIWSLYESLLWIVFLHARYHSLALVLSRLVSFCLSVTTCRQYINEYIQRSATSSTKRSNHFNSFRSRRTFWNTIGSGSNPAKASESSSLGQVSVVIKFIFQTKTKRKKDICMFSGLLVKKIIF